MIKINFTKKDGEFTLELTGHAGQAEPGRDIVCAATSILTYTVEQNILNMWDQGCLKKNPFSLLSCGNGVIICNPKDDYVRDVENLYNFAQTGYKLLAENFPQYVELTTFGKAKA